MPGRDTATSITLREDKVKIVLNSNTYFGTGNSFLIRSHFFNNYMKLV